MGMINVNRTVLNDNERECIEAGYCFKCGHFVGCYEIEGENVQVRTCYSCGNSVFINQKSWEFFCCPGDDK